jgi:serine/threonine protein kinase
MLFFCLPFIHASNVCISTFTFIPKGDLKPENIVITETGHIKLTDFGGCRPVTDEAKELLRKTEQGLLKNLRDGDWKANATTTNTDETDFLDIYNNTEEDYRVEGTTAYLPPEVVLGSYPTIAADSWALGCVMYQCLSGRPPLIDIDDESTKKKIVTFDAQQGSGTSTTQYDASDQLFSGKHASGIIDDARAAILSLLNRDPTQRPGMRQIAEHTFFTASQVNVFTMYQQPAYPLDVGTVIPDADNEKWSRRQFSSIWSPQPVAYDISLSTSNTKIKANPNYMSSNDQPIIEGDEERMSFFSPSGKMPPKIDGVHKSDKRKMMLPPS